MATKNTTKTGTSFGAVRAGLSLMLGMTMVLGTLPAAAFAEVLDDQAAPAQEQVAEASVLQVRAAQVASELGGTDKLAELWDRLAAVEVAQVEGTTDDAALAALDGEQSTAEGVTAAFVAVAAELGFDAAEGIGEAGQPVALVALDGAWEFLDVAAGQPGERPCAAEAAADDAAEDEAQVEEQGGDELPFVEEATTDEQAADEGVAGEEAAAEETLAAEDLVFEEVAPEEFAEEAAEAEAPAEEIALEEVAVAQDSSAKTTAQGSPSKKSLVQTADDKASAGLTVQAVSERSLALNGQWHTCYPAGNGVANACDYMFSLSAASRVELAFDNQWSNNSCWQIWDADAMTRLGSWSKNSYTAGSLYTYLRAGNYKLRVYPERSGSGYLRVKGTATAASFPVRGNEAFDRATSIANGVTTKTLFTATSGDYAYYKFTLAEARTVRFSCWESDSKVRAANSVRLFDAQQKEIAFLGYVNPSTASEQTLAPGTYYLRVSKYNEWGGPYCIKWSAVTYNLNAADANVSLSRTAYTYNGKAKTPGVTVTYGDKTLTKGTDYTVTYASGRKNAGTYTVTIKGKGSYTGTVKRTFKVNKAANTLKVTTATKTARYTLVRLKSRTVSPITAKGAKGKLTYAKVSGSKCLTVNKTTGKVTVKKGTKRGTYTIKVKVKAAGTANYKAKTITKTVKVQVK